MRELDRKYIELLRQADLAEAERVAEFFSRYPMLSSGKEFHSTPSDKPNPYLKLKENSNEDHCK